MSGRHATLMKDPQFMSRKHCSRHHTAGQFVSSNDTPLSCCTSFCKTCTVPALNKLTRTVKDLCYEIDHLKQQLAAATKPVAPAPIDGGTTYVFNAPVTFNTMNITSIGTDTTGIVSALEAAYSGQLDRDGLQYFLIQYIRKAPPNKITSNLLQLIDSKDPEDNVMAKIEMHNAIDEAVKTVQDPIKKAALESIVAQDLALLTAETAAIDVELEINE